MSDLRNKLKLLRKREGLSQKALADLTGIAQGAIGDIESGRKKNLSGESLSKLCNHQHLRKYALWLLTDEPRGVAEPGAHYTTRELLDGLTPAQQEQAVAFLQIVREQTSPD